MFSPFSYDPMEQASGQYYSGMTGQFMQNTGFNRPTYGQFGLDYEHMMRTPYGGQFSAPSSNIYYSTMVANPFKSFLTYKLPIFSAPKGLNPIAFDRYMEESKAQGLTSIAGFGAGMLGTLAGTAYGSSIGGPIGGFLGGALGGMAAPFLMSGVNHAMARSIQIHEASNLLNTTQGNNDYGYGLSMGQSTKLYKNMVDSSIKNPNFSIDERQLSFSELAKNSLIDDTGDFSSIKQNIKRMNKLVESLRDIFNGDIKQVVHSLRQLNTAGVDTEDLLTVGTTMGVAAAQLGQTTADYTANAINTSIANSSKSGLSKATAMALSATLDSVTDKIGESAQGIYGNHLSSKENTRKVKEDLFRTIASTTFGNARNLLVGNNLMGSGQYMVTTLMAGLEGYNKEHNTHHKLKDLLTNESLQHKVWKKAGSYMENVEKKFNGDYSKIRDYFMKKDDSYLSAMSNDSVMSNTMEHVNSIESQKTIFKYLDKIKNKLPTLLKRSKLAAIDPVNTDAILRISQLSKNNPNFWEGLLETSEVRTRKAMIDNASLAERRVYSGQGVMHSIQNYIKSFSSDVIERFASDKKIKDIKKTDNINSNIGKLFEYSSGYDFSKLDDSFYGQNVKFNNGANSVGSSIDRIKGLWQDNDNIEASRKRINFLTGDFFSQNNEDVKKTWAHQYYKLKVFDRNILKANSIKYLDYGSDNISQKIKDRLSGLIPLTKKVKDTYFEAEEINGGSVVGETTNIAKNLIKDIEGHQKEFSKLYKDSKYNIFTNNKFNKALIKTLKNKYNIDGETNEDVILKAVNTGAIKQAAEELGVNPNEANKFYKAKAQIISDSNKAILTETVGHGGLQGLVKGLGYKGTLTYKGAKHLASELKNPIDNEFKNDFVKKVAEHYSVSTEFAKKITDTAIKSTSYENTAKVRALEFNTISKEKPNLIFKEQKAAKFFQMGGTDKAVSALNVFGGDYEKLRQDLLKSNKYEKLAKKYKDEGDAGDIISMIGGNHKKESMSLMTSIKDFIKTEGKIKVNGHKYTSENINDLIANKKDFSTFIKTQTALGFSSKLGTALGLGTLSGEQAKKLYNITSKYYDYDKESGHFKLKKLTTKEKNELQEALNKMGIGSGTTGIDRLSRGLNGELGTSSLKETNKTLSDIYNVLSRMESSTGSLIHPTKKVIN